MKTSNEEFLDAMLRHQIFLLRLSSTMRNRILERLSESETQLEEMILVGLAAENTLLTQESYRKLEKLRKRIARVRGEAWTQAIKTFRDDLFELAVKEPETLQKIINTTIPVVLQYDTPDVQTLKSIVTARPFQGRVLRDWGANMSDNELRLITNAIQNGMIAGESNRTIVNRVIGTARVNGIDGVLEQSRKGVDIIARTAVMHVANSARRELIKLNADIITKEQFVATLDSRTTAVCRANDNKVFIFGKGPQPPLHIGCRSLRVQYFDQDVLSQRPTKPTSEKLLLSEFTKENGLPNIKKRGDLPRGFKGKYDAFKRQRVREMVGRVPAETSYGQWLKGQSNAFQEEVLGIKKAKLFREGGLSLDKFVDRSGKELTLGQLADRHKRAFVAAGLDPNDF